MVKFIADLGGNHNGSFRRIERWVDSCYDAGVWGVKPQFYKADKLFRGESPIPQHWEFREEWLTPLRSLCVNKGLRLGFSIFDPSSVEIVAPYSDFLKISSFDALRDELIDEALATNLPLFISTGLLSDQEESNLWHRLWDKLSVVYFHCTSEYPAAIEHSNLWKIGVNRYGGYSDHTKSPGVIHRAIAEGAEYIEFHYDHDMNGWETAASNSCWFPSEIYRVISEVSDGERAMGKHYFPEEHYLKKADPLDGLRPLK